MTIMLAIVVSVNIFLIALLCALAFVMGYMLRSSFISKCRQRIADLERDMLRDNARILELEREKVEWLKSREKK
jgi:hypothetical protein